MASEFFRIPHRVDTICRHDHTSRAILRTTYRMEWLSSWLLILSRNITVYNNVTWYTTFFYLAPRGLIFYSMLRGAYSKGGLNRCWGLNNWSLEIHNYTNSQNRYINFIRKGIFLHMLIKLTLRRKVFNLASF